MIKRDGAELITARSKNSSIAKETLEIIKNKHYTSLSGNVVNISNDLDAAIKISILYKDKLPIKEYVTQTAALEVTNETTAQAAVRLSALGKENLVALNFASARNPGGGFLMGAVAQEEDLCRCSGLYACIKNKPIFYNENILCEDTFYTDNIIYSPKVPFFRNEYNQFLEEPYLLSIISAPAPNLSSLRKEGLSNLLIGILRERTMKILQIAEANGHKNVILGAWGCGAFGNDPNMIATVFKDMLQKVPAFEHVCFAVYDTRPEQILYETFKKIII